MVQTACRLHLPLVVDNLNKSGVADRSRINLSDDYEVRYWTEELGVSEALLRELVSRVGNSASAVRRRLGK